MKQGIGAGLGALALLAAAIGVSVTALFTAPAFDALGFHTIALHYFQGSLDEAMLAGVRIGGLGFAPNEISHLADVKWLLAITRLVAAFAVGFVLALAVKAPQAFRRAALIAPLAFAVVGGLVVAGYFTFGFLAVGVFLHEIVFPQGNYAFDWNSLIIRLYGTDVMVRGAVFVIGLSLSLLVLTALAGRRVGRERIRPHNFI